MKNNYHLKDGSNKSSQNELYFNNSSQHELYFNNSSQHKLYFNNSTRKGWFNKRSSLTLDFSQSNNKRHLRNFKTHIKFQNTNDTTKPSNGKDTISESHLRSTYSNSVVNDASISMEDNFSVVLTSPDIDMVKLSTPDLDKYLIQLQQELSLMASTSSKGYDCDSLDNLQSADSIDLSEDLVIETDLNTPSFQEILDLSEKVSTEARFNSFDSGFSDISIKTEIESELDEDIHKEINWQDFENPKTEISFPECNGIESMSDICNTAFHNNLKSQNHKLNGSSFNCSKVCLDLQHEFHHHTYLSTNFNCNNNNNNNNNNDNKNKINNNNKLYHRTHDLSVSDPIIHQRQNRVSKRQRNKQEKWKGQHETFKQFLKVPNEFNKLRTDRENNFNEETSCWNELTCNSLDSGGGLCSDYSSIEDRRTFPQIHVTPTIPTTEHHGDISIEGFQFALQQSVDQPNNHMKSISNPDLPRHPMSVEDKRKLFRRQDAEFKSDKVNDGIDVNQFHCEDKFLNKYHVAKQHPNNHANRFTLDNAIKKEPQIEHLQSLRPTFNSLSLDLDKQELIKLQRKRARNRIAATRCRNRKQERINFLRTEVEFLKGLNSKSADRVSRLRHEVDQLKCHVMNHVTRGCDLSCLWVSLR